MGAKLRNCRSGRFLSVVMTATLVGIGAPAGPPLTPVGAAAGHPSRDCTASHAPFLTSSDLGAFTLMVNLPYTKPPWKGGRPGGPVPLFYAEYRQGRIVGYIANLALTGPDVPAERARERKLGYKGKWPLVPLEGPVVKHNPGLLEVYETIHSFNTVKAAKSWISFDRGSQRTDPHSHLVPLPPGAAAGVAWAGTMGPPKPSIEHEVYYNVRFGARVLELAFQGGSGVDPSFVAPYWQRALDRFTQSCS